MASEPMILNDLPDEILLKILSHIGPEDLCLNIAKVCERWNVLAKDKILWRTISYSCDNSSDISRIAQVLTAAPALHSLIVFKREDVSGILEFLNHIHGNLSNLILKYCCLRKGSTGLLAKIVDLYPDLQGLSLLGCTSLPSADYHLIPRLKKLSELNLSYCQGLSGETVRLIADSCQDLKKFLLDNIDLLDDDVIHVIDRLGKQLTTLVLVGQGLTDVAYLYLYKCSRLQELGLSWCDEMTDRGLLDGIGSLHELTHLRLKGGENLTAEALSLFLHRPSMSSIVSLDLSVCCSLDDEGLKGIAERCVHLEELRVSSCYDVTDAGIGMVIHRCNELRVLDLANLPYITDQTFGTKWHNGL